MDDINKLVDDKLTKDTEFQNSLISLSDEDRNKSIDSKRKELFDSELRSIRDKADKAEKAEEYAKNEKIRAEKAEARLKEKEGRDNELSTTDFYALTKANVPEEDINEVKEYAKFKGISISEALKSAVVKTTLSQKAEERKIAQAMNTRSTRTQQTPSNGDEIVFNIKEKGEEAVPDAGSDEAEALFWKRRGKVPPQR